MPWAQRLASWRMDLPGSAALLFLRSDSAIIFSASAIARSSHPAPFLTLLGRILPLEGPASSVSEEPSESPPSSASDSAEQADPESSVLGSPCAQDSQTAPSVTTNMQQGCSLLLPSSQVTTRNRRKSHLPPH